MKLHRLASIGVVFAFLLAGISCTPPVPPVTPPADSITRDTLDQEVIKAALVDLATASDAESQILRNEQGKGKVLFSNKCRDWLGTMKQEIWSAESESWKSLRSADHNAAKDAGVDALTRVENGQPFAPFHPTDPRIILWEDTPASTQPADPFARINKPRPIHAAPPGYADERRLAVVMFSFPWSMHGGDATYVLRFDGKHWNVISRHFSYYV